MSKILEVEMDYDINVPEKMMIISEAEIVNPETGESLKCKAFWDTGATGSCISARAARKLGLVAYSKSLLGGSAPIVVPYVQQFKKITLKVPSRDGWGFFYFFIFLNLILNIS